MVVGGMKYCGPSCQVESQEVKIERWLSLMGENAIALTIRAEWEGEKEVGDFALTLTGWTSSRDY